MIPKPLESITEADLQALIDASAPEGMQLDYKRELPSSSDQGKVKFLKEVTALANTQGGDLVYGMEEDVGIAHALRPLTFTSRDQLLQRLESLCTSGVEPRMTGLLQYQFVPLDQGGDVLVIRVHKSWNAPHRVTTGGHAHFYGRNANGCYQLDVSELRQSFTLSESVAERIRSFRADRLLKICSADTPVPLQSGPTIILHLVPIQSAMRAPRIDLAAHERMLWDLAPLGLSSHTHRINLDGYLSYPHFDSEPTMGYAQLFRDGTIESVVVHQAWNADRRFYSLQYEEEVIKALHGYFSLLSALGVTPPIYAFLSVIGLQNYTFGVDPMRFMEGPYHVDRDRLILPEMVIDDWSADPATVMRPAFDMVWNAFGLERSFNYDENGHWNQR